MKVQTLNENLTKALSGIKENQVEICNVIINRKPLLEALKINKKFDLITLETGKSSWNELLNTGEYQPYAQVQGKPCLRVCLDHTVMTLFSQELDTFSNPAKLDFSNPQEKQGTPLDSQLLIEAINYILPCVATEESRPSLNCIYFQAGDNTLRLTSADGFRLAITAIPAIGIAEKNFLICLNDLKKLLPYLKTLKPIGKGKSKSYPLVQLEIKEDGVIFHSDNGKAEYETPKISFPDYEKLIPSTELTKIDFVGSEMLKAVKSLSNICRDGTGIVRLKFKQGDNEGTVNISAKSEEYGQSNTDMDCKIVCNEWHTDHPDECKIAVNYYYLMNALTTAKDGIVTMQISHASSPMVLTLPDGKYQVIMPMFVQW